MSDLRTERIALSTGITLNVAHGGAGEPILFLHGFPESHRTWRHQLADLGRDHLVVAPLEVQEAVTVHEADVASMHPAIGVEGRRVKVRPSPVPPRNDFNK